MGNELRESIYIVMELLVFSALLAVIVYFSLYTKDLLNIHNNDRVFAQEMNAYRDFTSYYDNREVTGDDVLLAMKKYARVYNMCIVHDHNNDGVFNTISYHSKNSDDKSQFWNEDVIRNKLGDLVFSDYKAKFLTMDEIVKIDYTTIYPGCVDTTDPTIVNPSDKINDEILIFELKS